MVSPKMRRIIAKKRGRRGKRLKAATLSQGERERLESAKRVFKKVEFGFAKSRHLSIEKSSEKGPPSYNEEHRRNFTEDVLRLSRNFPGEEIIVLEDGPGTGHFSRELVEEVKKKTSGQVKVKVITLDIDLRRNPDLFGSPEQLVQFIGRNKVHMVVSTYGGVTYTEVSQSKAIANIADILKPGGFASIVSQTGTAESKHRRFSKMEKERLEAREVTEKTFKKALKSRPNILKSINEHPGFSLITIKKRK